MTFLEYYVQILLFTAAVPLAFGLAVYFCNKTFCALVGTGWGRPILLGLHAFLTPIREFAHLVAAMITFHRIGDFCLLNLHDPEGELGFVEHSYNRRNPIAVFGNFLFAILPAALGLALSLVVVLVCFRGAFSVFSTEVAALIEAEAGFGEYARLALGFLPAIFRDATTSLLAKAVGTVLLLLLSLGVYVSVDDLMGGLGGLLHYAVFVFFFAGVTALFDARARRLILTDFRTFATSVTALFTVVLVFALAALALGAVILVLRTLLGDGARGLVVYEDNRYNYRR